MILYTPPAYQSLLLTINIVDLPSKVGKLLTDIEDIMLVAKQFKSDPDEAAHFSTVINDSRIANDVHTTGITTHLILDTDFGDTKLRPKIQYYFVAACKITGITNRVEQSTPTRILFAEDVVRS